MGVEQIGQRARTEFDEDSSSDQKPSTSGADDTSKSSAGTRRFGEGEQSHGQHLQTCAESWHDVLRAGMMCSTCCLCCSMQDCPAGRSQQKSPFGSSGNTGAKRNANPFGPEKGSRSFSEPADLSPTMKPIPIDDTPWYKKITLAQVVSSIGICHGENPLYLRACVVCFKCMSALPGIILVCLHVP